MKTVASLIIGIGFLLTSNALAEDEKKGERGKKGDMKAKILEKFDTNKDGQLDETEKAALKKAMAERRANGEGKGKSKKGDMRKKIMEKFDTNGDGQLDETEKAALKKAMAERRANGEGKGKKGERGKKGPDKEGGVDPVRP